MAWLGIWFGISNTCGVWSNGVGQDRENDEEHDEECAEEGFQLTRVKFDINGAGGGEALGMGYSSINIWDGSGLKLAWSRKKSSYFKNNFPILCYLVIRIDQFLMFVLTLRSFLSNEDLFQYVSLHFLMDLGR